MLNLETELTRARYERISPIYDRSEEFMEWRFQPWREKIWQFAYGPEFWKLVLARERTSNCGPGKTLDGFANPYPWGSGIVGAVLVLALAGYGIAGAGMFCS